MTKNATARRARAASIRGFLLEIAPVLLVVLCLMSVFQHGQSARAADLASQWHSAPLCEVLP